MLGNGATAPHVNIEEMSYSVYISSKESKKKIKAMADYLIRRAVDANQMRISPKPIPTKV